MTYDFPLSILFTIYNIELNDGTVITPTNSTFRYLYNNGFIKDTYTVLQYRMVGSEEQKRLMKIGSFVFRGKPAKLIHK